MKIKALVIDDNRQIADSIVQMVKIFDIDADVMYGTRSALEYLKENSPRIVFLDINMPGLSGFEVLGYIKREPRLENTKVVIITSDDQPETAQRAVDGGAESMVIKPISIEGLEKVLKEINEI
jgi:CheY-like chemotaxis protein